jgi:hypothetical protein
MFTQNILSHELRKEDCSSRVLDVYHSPLSILQQPSSALIAIGDYWENLLWHNINIAPRAPISARLRNDRWDLHIIPHRRRLLKDIDIQSLGKMPSDVAMQRPDPRVVQVKLQDQIPIGTDELRIAALRVVGVNDGGTVPLTWTFGEDLHVLSMPTNISISP